MKAQQAPPPARQAAALPLQVAEKIAQSSTGGSSQASRAMQPMLMAMFSGPVKQARTKAQVRSRKEGRAGAEARIAQRSFSATARLYTFISTEVTSEMMR